MAKAFSGIQPTGQIQLGNYIGALRNWQPDPGSFYCVVDLHSISAPWDPKELRQNTRSTAALLLALGLGEGSHVFLQSHVHEHAELAWILNCLGRMGELNRMTQFKSKGRGKEDASVGLFTYPLLMASDILLYRVQEVPVGEDQKQHVELTRDIALRFNSRFGPVFTVPEPRIADLGARVMSLRNPLEKMSKSDPDPNSKILLTDSDEVISKKIMTAVTDSGREVAYEPKEKPGVSNLLEIASTLSGEPIEALAARFRDQGYGAFKRGVADIVVEVLRPLRQRVEALTADVSEIDRRLEEGRAAAEREARPMLAEVKEAIGLL
ncbi:MAG: tryptophan--tRNA ligase [Thermaerobacter sp.]|nr:tryptophan--tRNA ligase [Thermaerobacter sp.]